MLIENVETKVIKTPFHGKFRTTYGDMTPYQSHLIVRVTTTDGQTGLGEASPLPFVTGETAETMKVIVDQELAPVVIGKSIFSFQQIHSAMDLVSGRASGAKSAIDMALWDAQGKTLGLPTYKLMGGEAMAPTQVVFAVGHDEPANVAEIVQQRVRMGFNTIKIKVGSDPERDVETVAQVRKAAGPSVRLRLDANQGYTVKAAVQVIRQVAQHSVEYIEQPVHYKDLDGMAYIRGVSDIPVMADESMYSPQEALELAKRRAADLFGIKLIKCGGLYPALKIIHIAESAGIDCVIISPWDTWLGTYAGLHLSTLLPRRHAHEFVGPCYLTGDPFGEGQVRGSIDFSALNGLGVQDVFDQI